MQITVSTGCQTLDRLIGGGIIEGTALLINGGAGTGKSTLGLQFLVDGARTNDEKGLYILVEGDPIRILSQYEGLKLGEQVKTGNITILDLAQARIGISRNYLSPNIIHCPEADLNHALLHIFELIEERNIQRVVLDSIDAFMTIVMREIIQARDVLFRITEFCRHEGVTSMFISEKSKTLDYRADPFEEHVVDGVLTLDREVIGNQAIRTLQILKMRGLAHDSRIHPFKISDSGIHIISPPSIPTERSASEVQGFGIQEIDSFIPPDYKGLLLLETDSESTHWIPIVTSYLREGIRNNDPIYYLVTGKESRMIAEQFISAIRQEESEKTLLKQHIMFIDLLADLDPQQTFKSDWLPKYALYQSIEKPYDPKNVFELLLNTNKEIIAQDSSSETPELFRKFEILSEQTLELGENQVLQFLNSYYSLLHPHGFLCLGVLNPDIHSPQFTKAVEFFSDVIVRTWIADGQTLLRVVKAPYGQSQIFAFDELTLNHNSSTQPNGSNS